MRIVSVTLTRAGRDLAARLPYEQHHGNLGQTVRSLWGEADGFVLFAALGATVRTIAALLSDKKTDPAVVCVDEGGRFAVSVCGGHGDGRDRQGRPGANALAREVAALLEAVPVVTTATDAAGMAPLDALPGFVATGDVSGVGTDLLDGRAPVVENPMDWPLPERLATGAGPGRVVVTDRDAPSQAGVVHLHPPSLVVGVGTSTDATSDDVWGLIQAAVGEAGLSIHSIAELATIDRRRRAPAIVGLALPVRSYPASDLAGVAVPSPSPAVERAVGSPSVAEASALLAAGPQAELVVAKRKGRRATVAVARRSAPRGHLAVVGLGPGDPRHRTPAATAAVRNAEVVVGYTAYLEQCRDLLSHAQQLEGSPIGAEVERARLAVRAAATGRRVALVCSGDAGIYAMASVALEVAGGNGGELDVEVVPGIPAAVASSALLGAPLGHDHVSISLSDLLTPWEAIEERLDAAGAADMVVALYNPRSAQRTWQLEAARQILLRHRGEECLVGVVTDAGRPGEDLRLTTLGELDVSGVGMRTCVIVGSSTTRVVAGRMVTPRGYKR